MRAVLPRTLSLSHLAVVGTCFLLGLHPGACLAYPAAESSTPESVVNWSRHIAPLLYHNCLECHRSGGAAPFSLRDYTQAAKRARFLLRAVESGYMPPWPAGKPRGAFRNERHLSPEARQLLRQWVEGGTPMGDPEQAPEPPPPPDSSWPIPQPDRVLRLPEPFPIPARNEDTYHAFVLPYDLRDLPDPVLQQATIPGSTTLALKAFAIRSDQPRLLHHALAYIDTTGAARKLDQQQEGQGYPSFGDPGFTPTAFLGTYVPGQPAVIRAPGVADPIPPAGDIVILTHLTSYGQAAEVSLELALRLVREPVLRVTEWAQLGTFDLTIPPGQSRYNVEDSWTVPVDSFLLAVFPHMHFLGRSVQSWAILPDGTRYTLLHVPDWDFNWQLRYAYRQPVFLPAQTRLHARWVYDNSSQNPSNPHSPPQTVRFGSNSSDEMCELHFDLVPKHLSEYPVLRQARDAKMKQILSTLPPPPAKRLRQASTP